MGDMLTLIEEAEEKLDRKKAEEMADKLIKNKMDFNDLLDQFEQIRRMGPLKNVLSKLPGMEKQMQDVEVDDRQLDRIEAIILSMTPEERAKPSVINPSRKRRIAAGSGMKVEDVNRLIKQLEMMQKMIKKVTKKNGKKKYKRLPGLGGPMMGGKGGMDGMGGFGF